MAQVRADWATVDASVEVGVAQAQCAASGPEVSPDGLERRYRIKHVSGRIGVLTIRAATAGSDPRTLDIACEILPIRDAELERRVVGHVARRLEQLRGKDFAPIEDR